MFLKSALIPAGSPSSDKALIVSVGNESYLALDKGPIRDDHVLIIPTNHYPNTIRMPERFVVQRGMPCMTVPCAVAMKRCSCI